MEPYNVLILGKSFLSFCTYKLGMANSGALQWGLRGLDAPKPADGPRVL